MNVLCMFQVNLMIPWMRDQIAEAWHNRKSSRTADKRSLALSSVGTGNPASNNTMLMPLPTSPESFSVNVIRFLMSLYDLIVEIPREVILYIVIILNLPL